MMHSGTETKSRPEKIHALTSLRFFAAFYVVLFHTVPIVFKHEIAGTFIESFVSLGFISVSFFFLLSGYILAMVYLRSGGPVRKRSFYIARFARIYPLFLLTLISDLPYVMADRIRLYGWTRAIEMTGASIGIHLVMLQAWLPWLRGIDQPNWSLSVETVFYLIFPFIGVLLWKLKGISLWLTAAILWIAGQVLVTVVTPHVSIMTIKFFPLLHVSTFALGILLARWQQLEREKHGKSPRRTRSMAIALSFAFLALAAAIHWANILPLPNLNAGLLSPAFALLIWACSGSDSLPARMLSLPWLVVLGEASFGLYLIHLPVDHGLAMLHLDESKLIFPFYLAFCIALSVLSFYFVETPARKWLLRILQARPKETMEAASDAQ